jgi:hypothetical protein
MYFAKAEVVPHDHDTLTTKRSSNFPVLFRPTRRSCTVCQTMVSRAEIRRTWALGLWPRAAHIRWHMWQLQPYLSISYFYDFLRLLSH